MEKKLIRLTESDLHSIVKESVGKILKEAKKKDPMRQWFKDMEDIQKHRDNMEYITKGGRKPKHWNESDLHKIVKESVNKILMEAQSEGVQVRPYTENVFAVGNNSGVKFYVDRNGRFYDKNKQPTKNVNCLTDYDATQVAKQLNKTIGNMFHWEMFRGGNSISPSI